MAANLGTATLQTEVALDGLDSGLSEAKGRATSAFSNIGGAVAKIGGAAVVGGVVAAGAAVAGVGVAAFNLANDVDQATARIQTQLGLTAGEAEAMGDVVASVWGNNFGENIADVEGALVTVQQQMNRTGQLAGEELQAATENALALRDAFGVDVAESTNAANTLMEQFGLTSTEAMDFITAGLQGGLNASGDFLETIGEYSNQFAGAGADAGQFFSLMESGLQGGILGTDKAADAFKEFNVRILDGSDATAEALELLGLNADEFTSAIASGEMTAADAFQTIIGRMNETDDAATLMQAGVGLLGTQFEDLGPEGVQALSLINSSMDDVAGATDSLGAQYETLPDAFEGARRRIMVALQPLGDVLLNIVQRAIPYVERFAAWIAEKIPVAIEFFRAAWARIGPQVTAVIGRIATWWDQHGQSIIDTAMRIWNLVQLYFGGVWNNILGIFNAFRAAFSGDFEGFGASIGNILKNSVETAVQLLSGLWAMVQPWLMDLWTRFSIWFTTTDWAQVGLDVIDAIADAISGFWGVVQPWLADLWTRFSTWFTTTDWAQVGYDVVDTILDALETLWTEWLPALGQLLVDAGQWFADQDWGALATSIIDGLVSGITAGAGAVLDALSGVVEGAINAIKERLGIASPSKVVAIEIGEPMGEGVNEGFRDGFDPPDMGAALVAAMPRMATMGAAAAAGMSGGGGLTVYQDFSGAVIMSREDARKMMREAIDEAFAERGVAFELALRTGRR